MKTDRIEQIIGILRERGENPEYIISYLKNLIKGLQIISPIHANGYLDVMIQYMKSEKQTK